jgi:cyclopropane fatty-acyl-phospholipid synthase-like methyltransferase
LENLMGPHPLWLMEALTEDLGLAAMSAVLDLGCGRALTSIFLAKEFGVRVWASDLWVAAEENRARIEAAGVGDLVTAVQAEAHALPFDAGQFDAVLSVDAYHYFGTDDLYLGYLAPFLAEDGVLGIVVPGVRQEVVEVPEWLAPYWQWDFCSFHSPGWWRRHWEKTGKVRVERADLLEDGWRDWLRFEEVTVDVLTDWRAEAGAREAEMLRVDDGRMLGFSRVVAKKIG